jgi:predicted RNA binding protein YcfA (HicA-like mRNA interferase family)
MSLKPQPAKKIIKLLSTLGFVVARKRGSHVVMKHSDGRITVIPFHAGEDISRGLLMKIIEDTRLSKEEFLKLLKQA